MKKGLKATLITAGAMLVLGGILIGGSFAAAWGDRGRLRTAQSRTQAAEIAEPFHRVELAEVDCPVTFRRAEGEACRVLYEGYDKVEMTVGVEGDTLTVSCRDDRPWYEHINFFYLPEERLTVTLPEAEYDELRVRNRSASIDLAGDISFRDAYLECSSGRVRCAFPVTGTLEVSTQSGAILLQDMAPETATLRVQSGMISLAGVRAGSLAATTQSGMIQAQDCGGESVSLETGSGLVRLEDVQAGRLSATTRSGAILLEDCDGEDISLETGSGLVQGTLRTGKRFDARSNSGAVRVPENDENGGLCRVRTGSGAIDLTVKED